jgi:hypothetical protein
MEGGRDIYERHGQKHEAKTKKELNKMKNRLKQMEGRDDVRRGGK